MLVLLHGFPQTHVMWHRVAQALADRFFIVMPDLRGYGSSALSPAWPSCPTTASTANGRWQPMWWRCWMRWGWSNFLGATRAGAWRTGWAGLCAAVRGLCVIDIAPRWTCTPHRHGVARPAPLVPPDQPAPLPGNHDRRRNLHHKLGGWNYPAAQRHRPRHPPTQPQRLPRHPHLLRRHLTRRWAFIEPEALAEYERCFCRPQAIHSACEDYRASAGIDLAHDQRQPRARRTHCLHHTGAVGPTDVVQRMFNPMALAGAVFAGERRGPPFAGHFIPEELPGPPPGP